jgi:hypothetical protein
VARQAEESCFRYLLIGGSLVLVGLILMMTAILFWLGLPLAVIGAALVSGNIIWFFRLRRKQGIAVTCPCCQKEYTVLPGFGTFICTECRHAVPVPRAARSA